MSQESRLVVTVLDTIVMKGETAQLGKQMKNTTRIYEVIFNSEEPVTLNAIKTALDMKPGICSGSLASLLKSGQIERVQLTAEKGRKNIWGYVAKAQQKGVESSVE
jgi:predicted transcriptional regulator